MVLENGLVCEKSLSPHRGIFQVEWESGAVKVVYSDESGVGAKKDEPLGVVAAIVLNMDEDWNTIEAELFDIIHTTPPKLLDEGRALKGRILYSAARKEIEGAALALKKVLSVLTTYRVPIYFGAVDRAGHEKYHAKVRTSDDEKLMSDYDVAFETCLTKVDSTISTLLRGERVLWIADRSDKHREPATKLTLEHYRMHEGVTIAGKSVPLIRRGPICVADTIYFGNSKESVALQLADICCSTITLHLLEIWYGWKPIVAPYYSLIQAQTIGDDIPAYMAIKKLTRDQ